MRLNSKQIAVYTGGTFVVDPIDPAEILTGVTWDSREVEQGFLYVALQGERVDGHDFAEAALRAGARAVLAMEPLGETAVLFAREMGAAVIEVSSTTAALVDLARAWRSHLRGVVVGVTGSTGKTTTKNLVRDVAAAGKSVVATRANQNNELGVPRTLLAADPDTEVVVVEMGMRGAGQIRDLCDIVRPDWGLVTNVGESHIELLGSREAIACAKAELFEALPTGTGRAFFNGADEFSSYALLRSDVRERGVTCVAFDGSGSATLAESGDLSGVWAEDVSLDEEGRPVFTLCAAGLGNALASDARNAGEGRLRVERCSCHMGLRGLHNVSNACAAAAVGLSLGVDLASVAQALAFSVPEGGRLEVLEARAGFLVVNDAYNANPDSMRASLATFCSLKAPGRRYAVLGDMGELGDYAEACHRGIGFVVAALPVDELICVGGLASFIADGALAAGMPAHRVKCAGTVADVLEALEACLEPGDAVLVKASRFMGLDRVVEGLVS